MVSTVASTPFFDDKINFFKKLPGNATDAKALAKQKKQKEYPFINQSQTALQQEWVDLFESLKKIESLEKNKHNHEKFWLYCYYCTLLLKYLNKAYGKTAETEKYRQRAKEIRERLDTGLYKNNTDLENDASLLNLVKNKIAADLNALWHTPLHTSKIRDWISFTNFLRMQTVFSRLALSQSFLLFKELHWLDHFFNQRTSLDGMIQSLNQTAVVFNFLSVAVFASRLMINIGMILKHTFQPSEKEAQISRNDRFWQECKKRHFDIINDIVWGIGNGVSNYASFFKLFKLSTNAANWTMAGFMFFDVGMLLYRQSYLKQDYEAKLKQYNKELEMCYDEEYRNIIEQQKQHLESQWRVSDDMLKYNLTSAIAFLFAYPAALVVSAPLGFLSCLACVSMIVSGPEYQKYLEKLEANEPAESEKNAFYFALGKNAFMPLLVMGTYAVSAPAALVLTLFYAGYESTKDCWFKQQDADPSSTLSPPSSP